MTSKLRGSMTKVQRSVQRNINVKFESQAPERSKVFTLLIMRRLWLRKNNEDIKTKIECSNIMYRQRC